MKPPVSIHEVTIHLQLVISDHGLQSRPLALFTTFNENAATCNTLDVKVGSE